MNEKLRESVSALVDGEADDLELRRLLASADEAAVRTAWRDFHLQRDGLNGVDMQFAHIDLSQRIQLALADEAYPAAAVGSRWWRSLASVAVAASVATVVAVGARSFGPASDNGVAVAQVAAPSTVNNRVFPAQSGPAFGNVAANAQLNAPFYPVQPVALNPDQLAQQRLQQYLLRHTERAALNNGQGVIGFAKVSQLKAE